MWGTPQSGGSGTGMRSPQSIWLWRPVGLDCRSSTGWREIETPLLRAHTKSHEHRDWGQRQQYDRSPGQTYLLVLEGLLGRWGMAGGSSWGQRPWWWLYQGAFTCVSSHGGRPLGTRTWPHPVGCRLQCGDATGEITNWAGTQPLPSAERLPKDFLSPQPPLHTPTDTTLPTRGTRPSFTHQWAGTSTSCLNKEAWTSPWTSLTHQGADTRGKKTSLQQVTDEIKEEIKKYLETNESGNTMIQIYWTQQKQF